jgi:hypothetical protein
MKKLALILSLFAAIAVMGCGAKRVKIEEKQVTKNDIVAFNVSALKDKGKSYDILMSIQNVSPDKDIIIMLNDMQCFKGASQGELKHTFYNTGERTIDFRKGQLKNFKMVCKLGSKTKGDYRILVTRIFDNPGADGETKGKVLGSNIEVKLSAGQ